VNTKTKIHSIIAAAVLFITAAIFVLVKTNEWNGYSNPVVKQHIVVSICPAQDYYVDGTKSYYYEVMADVKYTQGTWPSVNEEILKSDTLLMLHSCSGD
jgi:hypothetical protein